MPALSPALLAAILIFMAPLMRCAPRSTVVMQSSEASTPKLRRETADYCRTEIAKVMKAIADGAPIDWKLEPVRRRC
jgi:hypothetical protein